MRKSAPEMDMQNKHGWMAFLIFEYKHIRWDTVIKYQIVRSPSLYLLRLRRFCHTLFSWLFLIICLCCFTCLSALSAWFSLLLDLFSEWQLHKTSSTGVSNWNEYENVSQQSNSKPCSAPFKENWLTATLHRSHLSAIYQAKVSDYLSASWSLMESSAPINN